MKITWKCLSCDDIVTSNSNEQHKMDFCKCGNSGCDLEEYICRWIGNPEVIEKITE